LEGAKNGSGDLSNDHGTNRTIQFISRVYPASFEFDLRHRQTVPNHETTSDPGT
jgi:hypothetical protein